MNPFNFTTMTEYSGRNAFNLSGPDYPAYATFNQIKAQGGKVRKGAHGTKIFCGYRDKRDKQTGEIDKVPTYGNVFLITDCDLPEEYLTLVAYEASKGLKPSNTEIMAELVTKIMA